MPTSVKINEIENAEVVAAKIQYKDFHVYVYGYYHDSAKEILWKSHPSADVRAEMKGTVDWPVPTQAEGEIWIAVQTS